MSQNDTNRHLCKNTQLKDLLQISKRKGKLKVSKPKRKTKHYTTIGELLDHTSGS